MKELDVLRASVSVSEGVSEVRECDGTGEGEKLSESLTERLRGMTNEDVMLSLIKGKSWRVRVEGVFIKND